MLYKDNQKKCNSARGAAGVAAECLEHSVRRRQARVG